MLAVACATPTRMVPARGATVYEVRHGSWLGSEGFDAGTRYVVNGRLSTSRPPSVDSVIDLAGGWVVPPFGEAHNHNVSYTTAARTDALLARYVHDGVLYAQNPGDVPRGRDSLRGRVNRPGAVDVIFANGLLTATGGHPTGLYLRNRARGGMTESDGDGGFLWLIDSLPDLDRKWSRILAGHPDIVKTVLVHSEEFARRRSDTVFFNWRGLDPALLPEIVHRAHAAGLRVMTHVETAADFRVAVQAGADEIGHVPGFRGDEHEQLPSAAPYEITPADAREAARRGTWVITTLGGISSLDPNGPDSLRRRAFDRLATRNLRVLREAGVRIAIGSDAYRDDSVNEVRYLATLGVLDPLSLLRMWSEATPRAIFPTRRVGCLADGCEASFLVLRGNPAVDFSSTGRIVLRMKDGELIR
jgi:imidazolonepropionase-like amidohydrolase